VLTVAPVTGAEPSIHTLVAGVPIIASGNKEIGAFHLDIEIPGMLATVKLACDGSEATNMLITAGKQDTPVWFVSQNKGMTFDAASASVTVYDDATTRCLIQDDGESIKLCFSIEQDKDATVKLDLPSFLHAASKNRKLDMTEQGLWRVTAATESGSLVIAKFAKSRPFTIRELEIRSAEGDALLFAFRNIALNEQANTEWPKFPDAELLPNTLKVFHAGERNLNNAEWMWHAMRTITVHSAIDDPERRKSCKEPLGIDWVAVKQTTEQVTPALCKLLCPRSDGQKANSGGYRHSDLPQNDEVRR
jgi:hypothetical protein